MQFTILVIIFSLCNSAKAEDLPLRLSGQILLQVEQNGEAWYVSPKDQTRYFMGRPIDAFDLMKQLGVGITNGDLEKIAIGGLNSLTGIDSDDDGLTDLFEDAIGTYKNNSDSDGDGYGDKEELERDYNPSGGGILSYDINFAKKQAGKILLQVEGSGEAWYVYPDNNKRYFLGRPSDAFVVMRNLGKGISNDDLDQVKKESSNAISSIEMEITEIEYDSASYIKIINDKLVFKAKDRNQSFLVIEGKEQKRYNGIVSEVKEINGRITYRVQECIDGFYHNGSGAHDDIPYNCSTGYCCSDDREFYVIDGVEQGKYDKVSDLLEIDDKYAFLATDGGNGFLVHDGVEKKKYDDVNDLIEIDGKMVYVAYSSSQESIYKNFIVINGVEQKQYDSITFFDYEANGVIPEEIFYIAKDADQFYIVHDDAEVKITDDKVHFFIGNSDKIKLDNYLVYYLYKQESDQHFVLLYDSANMEKHGEVIEYLVDLSEKEKDKNLLIFYDSGKVITSENGFGLLEINDNLVYFSKDEDGLYMVENEKKSRLSYDNIYNVVNIDNQLVYKAKENDKYFIVYGNQKQKEYSVIINLTVINNKLAYEVKDGDEYFVVYEGMEHEKYSDISELNEVNGKLSYSAKKDNKWYIVKEK